MAIEARAHEEEEDRVAVRDSEFSDKRLQRLNIETVAEEEEYKIKEGEDEEEEEAEEGG